ncbi:MAG: branched-chain amino acid ABC transporter permease [Chloroflexota bacterium]
MVDFIQNCLDGIAVGSTYALLAIGFTLIFGVMRRLNLAYGSSIMLGAFVGTWFFVELNANAVLVAVITIIATALVGVYVERLCFWAIWRGAALASMVSSFAIWMQLEEIALVLLPNRTYPFPSLTTSPALTVQLNTASLYLRMEHLWTLAIALGLMFLLRLLLYQTAFGLRLRAVAEDPHAARYLGINVDMITFWAFLLVSAIGGVAGYLILATDQQITPFFGLWATFKGLIAMMLGGMGSLTGAVIGGLLLGIIEMQSAWYLGGGFRDLSAFFLLFLILIVRPGGLLGTQAVIQQQASLRRV